MSGKQSEPALSDFWRRKRSSDRIAELANVLDATRAYVEFFGEHYKVRWGDATGRERAEGVVTLNYTPVKDAVAPFDGQLVDEIVGYTVDEVAQMKWALKDSFLRDFWREEELSSQKKNKRVQGLYTSFPYGELSQFLTVAKIIEIFFVENEVSKKYPTLGLYLKEARKLSSMQEPPPNLMFDLTTDQPSWEAIVTMWGMMMLVDKTPPVGTSPKSMGILNNLLGSSVKAVTGLVSHRVRMEYAIHKSLLTLPSLQEKEQERQKSRRMENENKQENDARQEPSQDGETTDEESDQPDKGDEDGEPTDNNSGQKSADEPDDKTSNENGKAPEKESDEQGETSGGEGEPSSESTPGNDVPVQDEGSSEEALGEEGDLAGKSLQGNDSQQQSDFDPSAVKAPTKLDLNESYGDPTQLYKLYSMDDTAKTEAPDSEARQIADWLQGQPENITGDVQQILGSSVSSSTVKIAKAQASPDASRQMERKTQPAAADMAQKLVFDKKMRTRNSRSLPEGKVDARRLYKAGTGNYEVFKQRDILQQASLGVSILVDASGSMHQGWTHEKPFDMAMESACALKQALTMTQGIDLMVLAYSGEGSYTQIKRIYDAELGEFRLGVNMSGGSPAGEALCGTLLEMSKKLKGKERLIIHITDGEPDDVDKVAKAVDYCLKNKTEVICIVIGGVSSETHLAYKGMVESIQSVRELPDKMISLLKTRMEKRLIKI
jgi:hypothetical protein